MGARYVWNAYGVMYIDTLGGYTTRYECPPYSGAYYGEDYTFNSETGLYTLTGQVVYQSKSDQDRQYNTAVYKNIILNSRTGTTVLHATVSSGGCIWRFSDEILYMDNDGGLGCRIEIHNSVANKTAEFSLVSSAIPTQYPSDAISGSFWYVLQGSDNIDPASVSIPAVITPGQQITITVTPGTGKVYGGTVSYQYQVKLDSGEWQTVATTTATTQAYTVPSGTKSIQARVVASDDLGFTSTTYVESTAANVIATPAAITVPGAAMVGQTFAVSWEAADGTDTYKLERDVDSGGWTQVYAGANLTCTDTAQTGWTSVKYRVSAGIDGAYGIPLESDTVDIIPASALVISGADGSLGTITTPVTYSVTSNTGNQITVTETIDGHSRTFTVTSGAQIAIPVSMIDPAADDAGEITIQASVQATSGTVTQTRSWTYTKTPMTLPTKAYRVEQLQGTEKDVMPMTLAEAVMMPDGKNLVQEFNEKVIEGVVGQYVGNGANTLTIPYEKRPKIIFIQGSGVSFQALYGVPYVFYPNGRLSEWADVNWADSQVQITRRSNSSTDYLAINQSGTTFYYYLDY